MLRCICIFKIILLKKQVPKPVWYAPALPSSLERWVYEVQLGQGQGPHLGQSNPKRNYRLGGGWTESSPEGKDLRCWWTSMSCQCVLRAQKVDGCLGCTERCGQQIDGGDSASLPLSDETSPGVLHPPLGPQTQEGHWPAGAGPEESQKDSWGGWSTCPIKT